MRESEIERYLVQKVARAGGRALKFVSPGNRGVPDRFVMFPGGVSVFVELKATWGRLSKPQEVQIGRLRKMGQYVWCATSKESVDELIRTFNEI